MGQSFDSQPVIAVRGREPSPLRQEKGRHARLEKGGRSAERWRHSHRWSLESTRSIHVIAVALIL